MGEGVGWGTGSVGEGGFSMGEENKSEEEGCALFGAATLDSCVKKGWMSYMAVIHRIVLIISVKDAVLTESYSEKNYVKYI